MSSQLRADLDVFVAHRHALPYVDRLARRVRDAAQRNAPAAAVWITARDDRVRFSHVLTDGQTIPDNLRFRLPHVENPGPGDWDLARYPGDPDLPAAQRFGCRCVTGDIPDAIARQIHAHPAQVHGTRVTATVDVRFPRVVESEFPDAPDYEGGWFAAALDEVARETRARQRPGA